MQRTPEAIAISQEALRIGRSMLALLKSDTETYDLCRFGLATLERWARGERTVADCRQFSSQIHEAARLLPEGPERNAIRSIGHAIATAHVSAHLKPCEDYAEKALDR